MLGGALHASCGGQRGEKEITVERYKRARVAAVAAKQKKEVREEADEAAAD